MLEQIIPIRIGLLDQFDLPSPAPCFHRFFAGDGAMDIVVALGMNQPSQPIPAAKCRPRSGAMLVQPRGQIGRYADVQHALALVGRDIDPTALHALSAGSESDPSFRWDDVWG